MGRWQGRWTGSPHRFRAPVSMVMTIAAAIYSRKTFAADQSGLTAFRPHDIAGAAFVVALVVIATVTALLYLRSRKIWGVREAVLSSELMRVRSALDRASVFLAAEPQIIISWGATQAEPDIEGDLSLAMEIPVARRILAFGSWLPAATAQALEDAVDRLRARGERFRVQLTTLSGRHLEAEGRAVAGRAVLRIRDISGDRLELTRLRDRHTEVLTELDSLRTLLDSQPSPAWARDTEGRLVWVNAAYAKAVEATDGREAVLRGIELLDRPARDAAELERKTGRVFHARVQAVFAGERRKFDVFDLPATVGSVGQAIDLSELEEMRADLGRLTEAHGRTLDQLATAVAIFDRSKRLVFHNAAYRQLWPFESAFLDQRPTDSEILDRLRAARRLPEQADFRAWKAALLSTYQSLDTVEQVWYLPDSRTLRVVINPNPQGGVTYLFDDVTERFHLESRYNSLIRVQGETLDSLKEGVAVFATDGRLKLFNPAFAKLWQLPEPILGERPHIDDVARFCVEQQIDGEAWAELRSIVAGLHDARLGFERRLVRRDGVTIDCVAAPLPDGATLLTFTDVTAGVNVERALKDRNQALLDAERLRNDFVHHVSYELRSPLTNIIGFIQLLADGSVGKLNDKQLEYAGYVMKSSAALLAIINDILDIATIDAGAMELSPQDVDIREAIEAAAAGLQDRLIENSITMNVVALDNIGHFRADAKRVRQVLFNLLSNAIGFSSPGQTVTIAAMRRGDDVVFKVTDQGRGIPPEVLDRVFDRFETHTVGSRHRGVGLGLSIVRAFVELHGGEVQIESAPGEGTSVTCIFPAAGAESVARTRVA